MKIDELIKTKRNEKKLTQKQLAEALFLSPKTISKWETGRGFPDLGILPKLSEVLGINGDDLIASINENSDTIKLVLDPDIKTAKLISWIIFLLGDFMFLFGYNESNWMIYTGFILMFISIALYFILERIRYVKIGYPKRSDLKGSRINMLWIWYALALAPILITMIASFSRPGVTLILSFIVMAMFPSVLFLIGYGIISLKK
ncbi:MAG: helix-turn-helix transcriptional regulator [Bacilli bacterium]|nr:helix-turn-helix transcriptional regulator [Bacilli bacterium]MBN2876578.1 helix-turn-helix transcriptional regulator [Bacilli bacterium]